MKLEQHVYTSGKPEFMTVAMTDGLSRDERISLESHSIYFLPIALHHQEHVVTPVKYIWYPLSERLFAVGRAIYTGKDSLGRTGNYLFHNYVISRDELLSACQGNPPRLITYLRRRGFFLNDAPSGVIQPLTLPDDAIGDADAAAAAGAAFTSAHDLPRDVLQRVLHVCLDAGSLRRSALLLGNEDECLDFLEHIYTALPYDVRLSVQADTYAYGVSLGFPIIGTVDDDVFRQGLTASCTLRLSGLDMTVHDEFPAPSPYLNMLLDLIAADNAHALRDVFALEDVLAHQRFPEFRQQFQQATPEIRRIVWDFHGSHLLNHIAADEDVALLRMLRPLLGVEHLDTLYLAPELIARLIDDHDPAALALVAQWLCAPGSKELLYPTLFASQPLWTAWLNMIQARPESAASLLMNPLKVFHQHYTAAQERILLERLLALMPALRERRKLGRDIADILAQFPPPSAAMPEAEGRDLAVLRAFIRAELGNDTDLLEAVLAGDLTRLPRAQRAIVLATLLDRIFVIRSLTLWSAEKAARQFRMLLTTAERDASFAIELFTALTTLNLSKDAHNVVKQALTDAQATLIQGEHASAIRDVIARVLELELLLNKIQRGQPSSVPKGRHPCSPGLTPWATYMPLLRS
jgi:hypothetical protein